MKILVQIRIIWCRQIILLLRLTMMKIEAFPQSLLSLLTTKISVLSGPYIHIYSFYLFLNSTSGLTDEDLIRCTNRERIKDLRACTFCARNISPHREAMTLPCKHAYHWECGKVLLEDQSTCKECGSDVLKMAMAEVIVCVLTSNFLDF